MPLISCPLCIDDGRIGVRREGAGQPAAKEPSRSSSGGCRARWLFGSGLTRTLPPNAYATVIDAKRARDKGH
eukprot:666292-Prorocentrum_minimum.AAC.1